MIKTGFSRPKKWYLLSWLIMWKEKTNFSHTYLRITFDKMDLDIVYDANLFGVGFSDYNDFVKNNNIVKEFDLEVKGEDRYEIIKYMVKNSRKMYGFFQIGKIALYKLFNVDSPIKDKIDGEETHICSEIVARILKMLGHDIEKNADWVTPRDLYEILEKRT